MSKPLILPYTTEPYIATPAFPEQHAITRPLVKTRIGYGNTVLPFDFPCIIDSGADHCVFPAQIGEKVGIPVRSGKMQSTQGIGADTAYFHDVKVHIEIEHQIWSFSCWAGFMYSLDQLGKGLLGRHGFFKLFEAVTFKDAHLELVPKKPAEALAEATAAG